MKPSCVRVWEDGPAVGSPSKGSQAEAWWTFFHQDRQQTGPLQNRTHTLQTSATPDGRIFHHASQQTGTQESRTLMQYKALPQHKERRENRLLYQGQITWRRKEVAVHMLLQKSFKKQMGLVMSWVCVTTEQENLQQRDCWCGAPAGRLCQWGSPWQQGFFQKPGICAILHCIITLYSIWNILIAFLTKPSSITNACSSWKLPHLGSLMVHSSPWAFLFSYWHLNF